MKKICLTVTCPSKRGVVSAVSTYLSESGCNILDSSQFDDLETGKFFMRISFFSEEGTPFETLRDGFAKTAEPFDMDYAFHDETKKMKVIIMVSSWKA